MTGIAVRQLTAVCRPYSLSEPRGLVSASSLRKVPLVGCQEQRDAICVAHCEFLLLLLFALFNFLEFHFSAFFVFVLFVVERDAERALSRTAAFRII